MGITILTLSFILSVVFFSLEGIILGIDLALLLHDILYHLGYAPPLGKECRIRGIHIHHAYIGITPNNCLRNH